MKKIIAILLAVVCFLNMPISVNANGNVLEYSDVEKEAIFSRYTFYEPTIGTVLEKADGLGYMSTIRNIKEDGFEWSLAIASGMRGEYPDTEECAEILTNLIVMQTQDIAAFTQNQSKFDDLKDSKDYMLDVMSIVTTFAGGTGVDDEIVEIMEKAGDVSELVIEDIEESKYYEVTIADYVQTKQFLEAVKSNAEMKQLKVAASALLDANDSLLLERIKHLKRAEDLWELFDGDEFLEEMSFSLLKNSKIYNSNKIVEKSVNFSEKVIDEIGTIAPIGEFVYKMLMLAGDIGFGTTDTFNRYQEMRVLADVANAITKENQKIDIPDELKSDGTLADIETKCNYYKMLIITHMRGEYLFYQLLVNDAGILSQLQVIFDTFKEPGETTDAWYERQMESLNSSYDSFNTVTVFTDEDASYLDYTEQKMRDEGKLSTESDEDKLIQRNYYDADGAIRFCETYAYYDNGLLCSSTLHNLNPHEYMGAEYTIVYLYDENGNLVNTILEEFECYATYCDCRGVDRNRGEVFLHIDSEVKSLYPESESIEQEKFGVDSSKTRDDYGKAPMISTDTSNGWVTAYLNDVFQGEVSETASPTCYLFNLNSDYIPEIHIEYHNDNSDEFYTYNGSFMDSIFISRSWPEWTEYKNMLRVSGDYGRVYEIRNGKFSVLGRSEAGKCYWNDEEITETEYYQKFRENIGEYGGVYENVYTYNQCKLLLQSIVSNTITSVSENAFTLEESLKRLKEIYNKGLDGTVVIFENDKYDFRDLGNGVYGITLRYQRPDKEMQEIIEAGGFPSTNVWMADVELDVKTGDYSSDGWKTKHNLWEEDLAQTTTNEITPPSDAETFESHHYKIFTLDSVKTWEEAKSYCESLGGHLATITSIEENDFLYQMMTEAGYTSAYFGLTDSHNEGEWIWVDGTVDSFTNWHWGEPSSENTEEDYAMFYWKFTDGKWNDGDFVSKIKRDEMCFICEWDS